MEKEEKAKKKYVPPTSEVIAFDSCGMLATSASAGGWSIDGGSGNSSTGASSGGWSIDDGGGGGTGASTGGWGIDSGGCSTGASAGGWSND